MALTQNQSIAANLALIALQLAQQIQEIYAAQGATAQAQVWAKIQSDLGAAVQAWETPSTL